MSKSASQFTGKQLLLLSSSKWPTLNYRGYGTDNNSALMNDCLHQQATKIVDRIKAASENLTGLAKAAPDLRRPGPTVASLNKHNLEVWLRFS